MTLDEIVPLKPQFILDYNWKTFIVEKSPCSIEGIVCRYRGKDGAKCAIGHVIPDSLYAPKMEEEDVFGLRMRFPEMEKLFSECSTTFLSQLQIAHDGAAYGDRPARSFNPRAVISDAAREEWADKLRNIAGTHNLLPPDREQ